MKKIVSIALALVLVLSLSVSAFAVGSPVGSTSSSTHTAPQPVVEASKADGKDVDVVISEFGKSDELSENEQKDFEEAYKTLADVAPEGMAAEFFVYLNSPVLPYTLTIKDAVKEASAMLYKDGKWAVLETTANESTIDVVVTDNGPVAVFVSK